MMNLISAFRYVLTCICAVIGCYLFLWIFAWMSYFAQHYGPGFFNWPH